MPKPRPTKRQKKESEDESSSSDSGPDDRNPPPKKNVSPDKKSTASSSTASKSELNKTESGDYYWDLARNRRVTVRSFKGKTLIDIREYYEKDGKSLPGKKGISLSSGEWKKLKEIMPEIDRAAEEI